MDPLDATARRGRNVVPGRMDRAHRARVLCAAASSTALFVFRLAGDLFERAATDVLDRVSVTHVAGIFQ